MYDALYSYSSATHLVPKVASDIVWLSISLLSRHSGVMVEATVILFRKQPSSSSSASNGIGASHEWYAQELDTGIWCLQMGNDSLQVKVSD